MLEKSPYSSTDKELNETATNLSTTNNFSITSRNDLETTPENEAITSMEKNSLISSDKLKKQLSLVTDESNKFTYLLIMRFIHAFLTLFNQKSKKDPLTSSILADYRLKNFFCLFKLADLSYEEFFEYSKLKATLGSKDEATNEFMSSVFGFGLDEDKNWQADTQRTGVFNHLYTSLESQRSLINTYVEDYFGTNL